MSDKIEYGELGEFDLDPTNPRLGRAAQQTLLDPEEVLDRMRDWSLEEIATSFLESGFWPQEAILCVNEQPYGEETLVVVEGNRRLAALTCLKRAVDGNPPSPKWGKLVEGTPPPAGLFDNIPYILLDDRRDVDAFLGFRHVTGIKEWNPAEKAQFIAYLINDRNLSYVQVMRKIGSKTPAVRQNFIAYSLLLQLEELDDFSVEEVESRFSVLYLSLRTAGVRNFLNIDLQAEPDEARTPVDDEHESELREYVRWLFGDSETKPFVRDSRQVDQFGIILASKPALDYLRAAKNPSFERAYAYAGGEAQEVLDLMHSIAANLSDSLSLVSRYKSNPDIREVADRIAEDAKALTKLMEVD